MKNNAFIKIIMLVTFFGLALNARADYIVNISNTQTINQDYIFNFATIDYDNWASLRAYKNLNYSDATNNAYATFSHTKTQSADMSAYLQISAPIVPAYNTSSTKYKNTTNTGNAREYEMFQVPNHPYLAFIITGVASASGNGALQDIKSGANNQILVAPTLEEISLRSASGEVLIKSTATKNLNARIYASLVIIPDASMPTGVTDINEKIGTLTFYETDKNSSELIKKQVSLSLKTKLDISLPSCQLSVRKIDLNLGKVSIAVVEAGAPVQSATFSLTCPTDISAKTHKKKIQNIYAKVYDVNFPTNRSLDGDLKIKCVGKKEAKGVRVRVKLNDKKVQLGDNLVFNPKFVLSTGALIADKTFLNLGKNVGTNFVKVSAQYVRDKQVDTIEQGCANAEMGIIFNYD